MSKQRIVKDEIWDDDWFYELDPSEKLVWLFLLTNPRANIAGVYKLNKKWAAQSVGLDFDIFNTILLRFVKDKKIIEDESWVGLVNFHKHLAYRNASVAQGILRLYKESTGCPQALHSVWVTLLNSTLLYLSDMGDIKSPEKKKQIESLIKELKQITMAWKQYNENSHSDDLPAIDADSGETVTPIVKSKPKKKVADEVQQVFDLFDNPAKVTWRMRELERVAAQALYDTYGIETLKVRIDRIQAEKNNKDPLFPLVVTPSQLLDKMPNVERYFGI